MVSRNGSLHLYHLAVDEVLREGEAGVNARLVLEHDKTEPTAGEGGREGGREGGVS